MTAAPNTPPETAAVLITGATGQLGRCLRDTAPGGAFTGDFRGKDELDISDRGALADTFASGTYRYCINCAAYTNVDLAETEQETAFQINATAPGHLAELCHAHGVRLIHLSTDYVYHNALRRPLRETDPSEPRSVYACSKLQGEKAVLAAAPNSIVLRTSWLYSEYGHNFVKTMLRLADEGRKLRVVDDQVGCPTYCRDLAEAIWQVVSHLDAGVQYAGIYNCANTGSTTWYTFARTIFTLSGRENMDITGIPTSEYPVAAERPPYSVLDTTLIRAHFGVSLRPWQVGLGDCLKRLRDL